MVRTWADDDPKAGLMTRKRALIVEAALKAFLERGYAESSVNKIADDAGVSIKTLYRHFETKDELFSAVMQAACSPQAASDVEGAVATVPAKPAWYSEPPNVALALAGEEYLRHALSDEQLALYRVVARDAHRFPELRQCYREEVMGQRLMTFATYLDEWLPRVGLIISDKIGALATFGGLLKASLFDDALLGVRKPSNEEISRRARDAAARMLCLIEAGLL